MILLFKFLTWYYLGLPLISNKTPEKSYLTKFWLVDRLQKKQIIKLHKSLHKSRQVKSLQTIQQLKISADPP